MAWRDHLGRRVLRWQHCNPISLSCLALVRPTCSLRSPPVVQLTMSFDVFGRVLPGTMAKTSEAAPEALHSTPGALERTGHGAPAR
jgi:hypothetical protein